MYPDLGYSSPLHCAKRRQEFVITDKSTVRTSLSINLDTRERFEAKYWTFNVFLREDDEVNSHGRLGEISSKTVC